MGVSPWQLVQSQCQQESPIWGAVKKQILLSTNLLTVTQHGCEQQLNSATAARPWGPAPLQLGPAGPGWFALHGPARCFLRFSSSQGNAVLGLWWKIHSLSQRGAGLYNKIKVPSPGPQLVTIETFWLVRPTGKFSVLLFERGLQELFYKGWLRQQKQCGQVVYQPGDRQSSGMEAGNLVQTLLHKVQFAWEVPAQKWLLSSASLLLLVLFGPR